MKKFIVILIACAIPLSAAYACTGFFKYDTTRGQVKICYYDHLGSTVAYNVKSYELCPVTIQVRH